jgi:hypothetical protein
MDKSARIAELLHEAVETHHVLYRITDGRRSRLGVLVRGLVAEAFRTAEAAWIDSRAEPPRI